MAWRQASLLQRRFAWIINRLPWVIFLKQKQKSTDSQEVIVSRIFANYLAPNVLTISSIYGIPWWRHQMETFSALLAICAGNSPVPGEFPTQRPVTRSFDVYFDLRPNKQLSKQSWGWWFETLSPPLWRHRNVYPKHSQRRHKDFMLHVKIWTVQLIIQFWDYQC